MKQFTLTLLFPSITSSVVVFPVELFPFLPDEAGNAQALSAAPSRHFHHMKLRLRQRVPPPHTQTHSPPSRQGAAGALHPAKM